MRILIALTYYRPHYSGLTIYTERLARALAKDGNQVTVITSQFSKDLAREEMVKGVCVVRMPVWLRVSKGVIMPGMPFRAWKEIRKADVVNLHVPQLDAAPMAVLARFLGKPVVLTYHCDLLLPGGLINRIANFVSNLANRISAGMADVIVTNTQDYAEQSPFLRKYLDKVRVIPPPVVLQSVRQEMIEEVRQKYRIEPGQKIIGMVARLAAEKGAEFLVKALPEIIEKHPTARVLYAGQYQDVMGEEAYAAMLAPMIEALGARWQFLGLISDEELAAFYKTCDVVVVPSINSTESFGIVQVEGMTCGKPAVASDMAGVRQPVLQTGMGEIFTIGDPKDLAQKINAVLDSPEKYSGDVEGITKRYAPATIAGEYEQVFREISR
jgi:glycosyltransferase involved in cell wall biosynthesis